MDIKDLQNLLSQPYKQDNWKEIVQFVFPNVSILATPKEFPITNDKIIRFSQIGTVKLTDGKNLALFELLLADHVNLQRNRVELNNEISKYIDQEQIHGVLSVFEQGGDDYRFTFSARSTEFDEEESDFVAVKTDTKRFTYVLGKNESCKTPAKRFYELSTQKAEADIATIQKAFSVETLSKEFFDKYKKQFEKFWIHIAAEKDYKKLFLEEDQDKQIRDFTKKLLGRIVFLHFLQKKGWMGCDNTPDVWENGDKRFMQNLYLNYSNKKQFHSQCLSQLFFDTLNNKKDRPEYLFTCRGLEGELNNTKIPYLNGGLFDTDADISKQIDFPESFFAELFEFFGQYNFTIDENDPNDHEVGIDPEMLGHIFENLLEDNKDKGAFYTPKVIVRFMCQESLIEYLATKLHTEENKEYKPAIENLVRNRLAEQVSDFDLVEPIARALYEVKICDPAIGSGAFPMGILNEIYQVVEELYGFQPDAVAEVWKIDAIHWQPHLVKKNIIQHSIYGVDLESGAVDIARLRFWLALVVDEVEPLPLPNLDYKIMQGNSLLESFEGVDLSQISNENAYETEYETQQIDIFTGEAKKKVQISLVYEDMQALMDEYFNSSDPDEKKLIHKRIDAQVINHIHYTFTTHKKQLQRKINKAEKKIKIDQEAARTADQKIKISEESKAAKELAKLKQERELINQKEIKLAQLSLSNDKPFFLWRLFFKEVFDKGKFDIIIGNPPYLSNKGVTDEIKNEYGIKDDLYNYFFIKGDEILAKDGIFCYITSNTFLTLQSKLNIRELLLEREIINISNLGYDVFETAMVSTAITIYRKRKFSNNNKLLYIDARGKNKLLKAEKYFIKQEEFINTPNNVFFTPNKLNLSIHNRYSEKLKKLIAENWDKISTSRNITKFNDELSDYRTTLKEGDITLLGLVTDGGQGMATANNGRFVGVKENSRIAERIYLSRIEKLKQFNKKQSTNFSIENKDEFQTRELFDELKLKYGRDCFGQGFLFRIVSKDEIADVNILSEDEKHNGIEGERSFVPYDKGDKEGNRWYLETPYYINWNKENVKFLFTNSGKKGKGMPVVRNPQFYFQEGFCWNDIHTIYIKARYKGISIHDVKSMSLFPLHSLITEKYIVCILNSKFASQFSHEFLNNTSSFQINDARLLPIIVPNKILLEKFETIYNKAYDIQIRKFSNNITEELAKIEIDTIQKELDEQVKCLYFN